MDLYREAVEMAHAEIMDALTSAGVPSGRAEHLLSKLMSAVSSLAEHESADATDAMLAALAPRLGLEADTLVWLADHAHWKGHDVYQPHTVAVVGAN